MSGIIGLGWSAAKRHALPDKRPTSARFTGDVPHNMPSLLTIVDKFLCGFAHFGYLIGLEWPPGQLVPPTNRTEP